MKIGLLLARWTLIGLAGICAAAASAAEARAEGRAIQDLQVNKIGETYWVVATLLAPVPLRQAWAVLTDFDAMASFVPNVKESRVISADGQALSLRQSGVARFGPFSYRFESTRRIELRPYASIQSSQLSGSLRKMESITTLTEAAGGTRIVYRVELVPALPFPGLVGETLVSHEVSEQFEAIVAEMLRRQANRGPR